MTQCYVCLEEGALVRPCCLPVHLACQHRLVTQTKCSACSICKQTYPNVHVVQSRKLHPMGASIIALCFVTAMCGVVELILCLTEESATSRAFLCPVGGVFVVFGVFSVCHFCIMGPCWVPHQTFRVTRVTTTRRL
jgi:hypothetical protein